MEFTLNVKLDASENLLEAIKLVVGAVGNSQNAAPEKKVEIRLKPMDEDEQAALKAHLDAKPEITEEVKEEVVETPKVTRTRKPAAPKVVEETVVEEPKPEVVEKGTGDFVPDAVAIRSLAIPLAKAGYGVKEKLTELGYGGIGQLSEGSNEEHIKTFYEWLLEETKSLK